MTEYRNKFCNKQIALLYKIFDKVSICIILSVFILVIISCIILYCTSGNALSPWAYKQGVTFFCFFILAIIIALISSRFVYDSAYHIYALCLLLLIIAHFFGHTAMGAQRWIRFGILNIQPSEWMKLALILALSKYFAKISHQEVIKAQNLIIPCIIILLPVIFILKQPNLGTVLILLFISCTIFFATGVRLWKFFLLFIIFSACIPLCWKYALHDYQRQRVITFLNPETDLLGAGYNVAQSKIAIGSGSLIGKGLTKGTQNQLSFLPEKHTDFIGSIIAEEMGFLGIILIMLLYIILLTCLYIVSISADNHYGSLVALGIASMFFIHIFINLAMISGIIPVVGIQLPLLSYGGSNLGMALVAIGFILNIKSIN